MEKINIAEVLKYCPKGMELDCTTWENVTFEKVVNDEIYIKRNNKTPSFDKIVILNKYGCCTNHQDEKCRIFPKGKTTWEGFVPPCKFKDGDILVHTQNDRFVMSVYHKRITDYIIKTHCVLWDRDEGLSVNKEICCYNDSVRFATEEEKEKLFQSIKENGYKWNAETKTLENLIKPRFKVGDRIKWKGHDVSGRIEKIEDNVYHVDYGYDDGIIRVNFNMQDDYELVPNKFDINTLKPFDKVLVRVTNDYVWIPKFFSYYDTDPKVKCYPFVTTDNIGYPQCIPYNGNEHLCRTIKNCDKFYRVWKE